MNKTVTGDIVEKCSTSGRGRPLEHVCALKQASPPANGGDVSHFFKRIIYSVVVFNAVPLCSAPNRELIELDIPKLISFTMEGNDGRKG